MIKKETTAGELHLQKLCPIFGVQFTSGRLFLFYKNSHIILIDVTAILHLKYKL